MSKFLGARINTECKIEIFDLTDKDAVAEVYNSFTLKGGTVCLRGLRNKEISISSFAAVDWDSLYVEQCACAFIGAVPEPEEPKKVFKEYIDLCHRVDDPKCKNPILAALYTLDGVPCIFSCDDLTLSTPLDIKDYQIMGRQFGRIARTPIQEFKDKLPRITIEGNGAPQDVRAIIDAKVAAAIAGLAAKGVVIPDTAKLDVSCIKITQHPDKKMVHDDIDGADETVASEKQVKVVFTDSDGNAHTDFVTVGDEEAVFGNPLVDNGECVGKALEGCEVKPTELMATTDVGSYYEVCFELACFAPAPVA